MSQCQGQFHCLRPSINSLGLNIFDNFDIIIIMSVCDRLHSYYHLDRSWISSSIDVVKLLVKLKNSVMPAGDEKKDEAAFVSKVTSIYELDLLCHNHLINILRTNINNTQQIVELTWPQEATCLVLKKILFLSMNRNTKLQMEPSVVSSASNQKQRSPKFSMLQNT